MRGITYEAEKYYKSAMTNILNALALFLELGQSLNCDPYNYKQLPTFSPPCIYYNCAVLVGQFKSLPTLFLRLIGSQVRYKVGGGGHGAE
jgi:hypothetical protein